MHIRSYAFTLFIVLVLAVSGAKFLIADVNAADNADTGTGTKQTGSVNSKHSKRPDINIFKTAKESGTIAIDSNDSISQAVALPPGLQRQGCGMIALKKQKGAEITATQKNGKSENSAVNSSEPNTPAHGKKAKKVTKERLMLNRCYTVSVRVRQTQDK